MDRRKIQFKVVHHYKHNDKDKLYSTIDKIINYWYKDAYDEEVFLEETRSNG